VSSTGLSRLRHLGVAFLAGWVIMALEIAGARLLAPAFGYSIYQWGALIGVVMTGMALGYELGGRVGDRPGAPVILAGFLAVTAVYLAVVPHQTSAIFARVGVLGPVRGAVAACVALVGLPSLLLASTSPIVIRLTAGKGIAQSSGRVFAASTVGGIAGTFFTAFHAIPVWGTTATLRFADGLLVLALVLLLPSVRGLAFAAATGVLLVGAAWFQQPPPPRSNVLFEDESAYGSISVRMFGTTKAMLVDHAVSTLQPQDALLTGSYDDFALLAAHLSNAREVVVLGVAGGNSLRQLVRSFPALRVTGVELDPAVLEVARAHFGVGDLPRTTVVAEDARRFLAIHDRRYDVVFVDLFVGRHVPWFATTAEFFELLHRRLTPGGILLMNIGGTNYGEDFTGPLIRTVRESFDDVYMITEGVPLLLATRADTTLTGLLGRLTGGRTEDVQTVLDRARRGLVAAPSAEQWPVLTDDLNDIELRAFGRGPS
jgi:spermidine synthase